MKFSTISNIGKFRDTNEDSYGNISKDGYDFFIVADGMGGHSDGELASSLAIDSFVDFIEKKNLEKYDNIVDFQDEAISFANKIVFDLSFEKKEKMGTTIVCMCIDYKNNQYHISHVGDSRLYLIRDGKISQITKDHSLLNELLDSGALREDEAKHFANKSAITRAVGISDKVKIESRSIEFCKDDVILMVTDGLTNELDDEKIKDIVEKSNDVFDISTKLVDAANASGGRDNITVTTIKI